METITQNTTATTQTVKAAISEKLFFKSLGNLFASSQSVLGELLQNARRAGASQILVEADAQTSFIALNDDGCGIDNFQHLLQLCESGWTDEEVIVSDKPFGMGFFSVFYACQKVVIYSKGQRLEASVNDIVEGRQLKSTPAVLEDVYPHLSGTGVVTRIELHGADAKIIKPALSVRRGEQNDPNSGFIETMEHWTRGFSLPVLVNGTYMPRPEAKSNLTGGNTSIGFVSSAGIHREGSLECFQSNSERSVRLYLQGLPIGSSVHNYGGLAAHVVHLDSAVFVAKMPDRDRLRDHQDQIHRIEAAVIQHIAQWLCDQKAKLDPKEFMAKHFAHCQNFGGLHLLNDIPFLPKDVFSYIDRVSQDLQNHDVSIHVSARADELVSRNDIVSGEVKVWINGPGSADECHLSSTALKVMQIEDIWTIDSRKLDEGHWLFTVAPHWKDLDLTLEVVGAGEKSAKYCWSQSSAEIRFANQAMVTVRSNAGVDFSMVSVINNDWLLFPKPGQEDDDYGHYDYDCYLLGVDKSNDDPIDAMDCFTDEWGAYLESARNEALRNWDDKVASLRDDPLHLVLARHMLELFPGYQEAHMGQLVGVRLGSTWREDLQQFVPYGLKPFGLDENFMAKVSAQLSQNGVTVTPEALMDAVNAVAMPGRCLSHGPHANTYLRGGQRVPVPEDQI